MKNIIVAYGKNNEIGAGGRLLWDMSEMKEDMDYFRSKTNGAAVIMGRKTLESIGFALPGRQNIVLTGNPDAIDIQNIETAASLDEAYKIANRDEVFVIGGGEIYCQAIETVDRIYATEVDVDYSSADTFFPEINESWSKISSIDGIIDENNIYRHDFVIYGKK